MLPISLKFWKEQINVFQMKLGVCLLVVVDLEGLGVSGVLVLVGVMEAVVGIMILVMVEGLVGGMAHVTGIHISSFTSDISSHVCSLFGVGFATLIIFIEVVQVHLSHEILGCHVDHSLCFAVTGLLQLTTMVRDFMKVQLVVLRSGVDWSDVVKGRCLNLSQNVMDPYSFELPGSQCICWIVFKALNLIIVH